jgi:iron complex outermembrane receptor protein
MRTTIAALPAVLCALGAHALAAQSPATKPDTGVKIKAVQVTAEADGVAVPALQRATLPVSASITAKKAAETVNLVDAEDAVKYLPTVFLRKRNNGDTQAVMATRTWGISSSARSLIFADGVPLTALIANNNNIGGPRWGLVSPSQIERIDMMFGPFSSAYGGNSMGAVMEITTRKPTRFEGTISQTMSSQAFSLYGTDRSFGMAQTAATLGNTFGRFSFWANVNYQDSKSQPLTYVTSATIPAGTTGAVTALNKLGTAANVVGASGLLHTKMLQGTVKASYDLTSEIRATYSIGLWQNTADAASETYAATTASSTPTYAGLSGFASGTYALDQRHLSQSISLRSDTRGAWDFEAVASSYHFGKDQQRFSTSASATGTTLGTAGRVAVLDGTGWSSLDVKGIWRPDGLSSAHMLSAGVHGDHYTLFNPTYNTTDWTTSAPFTTTATEGDGKTETLAAWLQDRWSIAPTLTLTAGGRYERFRAFGGYNANGATTVTQPELSFTKFSPKAVLAWTPTAEWSVTASAAQAYRFATASELYQLVSTGATFTAPAPNLKPDDVIATEVRVERADRGGRVRVALFQDDIHDAIISQFLPLVTGSPTLYSYLSNVDHVVSRGVEVVLDRRDLFITGFDFSTSATYVNARTVALSGQASATAPTGSAIGKRLPNIPDWRANFVATYRPVTGLGITLAGRYSSAMYTTLDNADVNTNTYQGFTSWFVADARVQWRATSHWTVSGGVDNVLNRKYFLFHPFPQRTLIASLQFGF